jgi:hypothetical protein
MWMQPLGVVLAKPGKPLDVCSRKTQPRNLQNAPEIMWRWGINRVGKLWFFVLWFLGLNPKTHLRKIPNNHPKTINLVNSQGTGEIPRCCVPKTGFLGVVYLKPGFRGFLLGF